MGKIRRSIILLFLIPLIGCTGVIKVGSEHHRATLLYFEGGSGQIKEESNVKLINRCKHLFYAEGFLIRYMNINHPNSFQGVKSRLTYEHAKQIQKKVDQLTAEGHNPIWLMGISNGALSVVHAGVSGINGVEGLIIVNPRRDMYSPHYRDGTFVKFSLIKLPILLVTHEKDNNNMKNLSQEFFKSIFRSSRMAEIEVLNEGVVGVGANATHLTQKYQHGLMGNEKRFVQIVSDFIARSRKL